jgi:hypothetical protein
MISTNSVLPSFVNLTRAEIVSAFGGSQVSSRSPPFTAPCQLPVSQASLSIWISGAFAVEGFGCCAVAQTTSTAAAIVVISSCFISLQLSILLLYRLNLKLNQIVGESEAGQVFLSIKLEIFPNVPLRAVISWLTGEISTP